MITLTDIESWVRGGESETLEFIRTTSERREAARTICAMLNHRGGHVIFGVEPDGRMAGQMVSDRTVEEVAQDMTERQQRGLTVLSESDSGLALREVHERIGQGITERQARKDLEALRILGLAQATGHGRGSRWRLS